MSEDIEIINQNTRIEKIKNFFITNYKNLIGLLVLILLIFYQKCQLYQIAFVNAVYLFPFTFPLVLIIIDFPS